MGDRASGNHTSMDQPGSARRGNPHQRHTDIGNRTVARFGGKADGTGLRQAAYGDANALNQLTFRTVPGAIVLTGSAPEALTLQGFIDGRPFSLDRQEGGLFFGEASAPNASWPVFAKCKVVGLNAGAVEDLVAGEQLLPQTPESFEYDADGNLTRDGRFTYTWDAENRLVAVETRREAFSAGAPKLRLVFGYDSDNRRFKKEVWQWDIPTAAFVLQSTSFFVYDGWNLIGELDAALAPQRLYQWGLDLSGSPQGAGGVGGLLAIRTVADGKTYYPAFDGNGNVMALVDAADGTVAANYEYGPCGEPLKATGPLAKLNPFRFSTKYHDEETGLVYYGFRYLGDGVWLSRDPAEESGGKHLYGFVRNRSVGAVDSNGLREYENYSGQEWYTPADALRDTSIVGTFTFEIRDYAENVANGSITVGVLVYRTGQLRLDYVDLSAKVLRGIEWVF